MNKPSSPQVLEQVLFERMGVSVEDAMATGTDFVDEKVAEAQAAGIDVEQRMAGLISIVERVSQPEIVTALEQLLEALPQLAELAQQAAQFPNIVATLGDVLDDYQKRCAAEDIDLELSLVNGLHAVLWLGNQIREEDLTRMGELLQSDVLNRDAVQVIGNAAQSLAKAQSCAQQSASKQRIGLFGLLRSLRKPDVQRSLAFAMQFGECFGKNLADREQEPS